MRILKSEYVGKKECFCVTTNTGRYETNGFVSHNSVALQNYLVHCIEHRNNIAVGLIDIKQTEFSNYKGMNGVVGVANTVKEATELLRIARAVMYKRNKEMAKMGIKAITEHVPTEKTDLIYVTGRDYNKDEKIQVRENGAEKTMTAGELADYLQENPELITVEVNLNGQDWIPVNANCVDWIYLDTMPMLVIICDEMAELTMKAGLKTLEGKEEDQMKDEIVAILNSIAQLGRSSGIHILVATQRSNATVIPTTLRSNLAYRQFCGKATEAGSSLVCLDNNLATTIDNTYPGASIVQPVGKSVFTRVYFSKFSDLDDYYKKRGLDKLGYSPNHKIEEEQLETLEGEELLDFGDSDKTFEFEEEKAVIDQRQDQEWEEING